MRRFVFNQKSRECSFNNGDAEQSSDEQQDDSSI